MSFSGTESSRRMRRQRWPPSLVYHIETTTAAEEEPAAVAPEENSLLEVDRICGSSTTTNYSTFNHRGRGEHHNRSSREGHADHRADPSIIRRWGSSFSDHFFFFWNYNHNDDNNNNNTSSSLLLPEMKMMMKQRHQHKNQNTEKQQQSFSWWKLISILVLCTSFGTYRVRPLVWISQAPEWRWDHNVYYNPSSTTSTASSSRTSLLEEEQSSSKASNNNIIIPPLTPEQQTQQQQHQHYSNSTSNDSSLPPAVPPAPRNLLLTQVAGTKALKRLGDISGRPNRAYARQWGRDYAIFWRKTSLTTKSCFDKTVVLNTIMDKQRQRRRNNSRHPFSSSSAPPQSSSLPDTTATTSYSPSHVQYDVIALLPPDAIVTNLDYDLLSLMPSDKLVSISGWDDGYSLSKAQASKPSSRTDVVFFNMRHKYADAVAQVWWDMVAPTDITCGAGNELQILLSAIQQVIVVEKEDEVVDLNSLVFGLNETDQGFVGMFDYHHVIKGISTPVPTSKAVMLASNFAESRKRLQTTADSVCYRYYPKCEVL